MLQTDSSSNCFGLGFRIRSTAFVTFGQARSLSFGILEEFWTAGASNLSVDRRRESISSRPSRKIDFGWRSPGGSSALSSPMQVKHLLNVSMAGGKNCLHSNSLPLKRSAVYYSTTRWDHKECPFRGRSNTQREREQRKASQSWWHPGVGAALTVHRAALIRHYILTGSEFKNWN